MRGKVLLCLAVLGALVLAGCASPEPLPNNNTTPPATPPGVPPSMPPGAPPGTPPGPPPSSPPGPPPPPATPPGPPQPPVPPADTNPVTVRVIDNDYDPRAIATETGGSVRFTNEGDAQHSVTLQKDGAASAFFDETIQPGQSVLVSFPEAGHYDLRCIYHSIDFDSGQVGDITVG